MNLPVPVLDPGALILPLGPSNWVLPPTRFGRFFQMGHISWWNIVDDVHIASQ
jgi:hypothetical protein